MSHFFARVLYSKQVTRKRKAWQDGFVAVNNTDQYRRSAKLYDESGVTVATGRVPTSESITLDTEGITAFEGYIVNVDSVCAAEDVPSNGRPAVSSSGSAPAPISSAQQSKQTSGLPGQPCKQKSTFQMPRPVASLDSKANANEKYHLANHALQRLVKQHVPGNPRLSDSKPAQAQPSVLCSSTVKRTDDDILNALLGSSPIPPTRSQSFDARERRQTQATPEKLQHSASSELTNAAQPLSVTAVAKHHLQNKWAEFTESEAPCNMRPASISGKSQDRTLLQVSPMQLLSEPVASMTQAAQSSSGALFLTPNPKSSQKDTPDTAQRRQATASSAFAELTNQPSKLQTTSTGQHEASSSKQGSHSDATLGPLKVPPLGRQKAFKAPAIGPGHQQMQHQSMTPSQAQQPRTSPDQEQPMGSQTGLVFPGSDAGPAQRNVTVPTSFASLPAYKQAWSAAVTEEINIRLADLAKGFHKAVQQQTSSMQKGVAVPVRPMPADLEKGLRSRKILYYSRCELVVYQQRKPSSEYFKSRSKKAKNAGSSDDESGRKDTPTIFLQIQSGQEKPSAYQKDDLWVLSSQPCCQLVAGSQAAMGQGWLLIACSSWHGPNKDGRMQIQLLSDCIPKLHRKQSIYAIHGPNAATELAMLATLQGLDAASLPALPALMSCKQSPAALKHCKQAADTRSHAEVMDVTSGNVKCEAEPMEEHAKAVAAEFKLNCDQMSVLAHCSRWAASDKGTSPVCIIHGPFGCGKSSLLMAVIHYLLKQRNQQGSALKGCRVLLSAHTNVAVDRLMTGLMESGCTDMVRVGALRRISKDLLPHSLHAVDSKAKNDAASELKDMLAATNNAAEAAVIQRELDQLKQGADRQRKKKLKSAGVVGVTCCSAGLPVLEGLVFDVVLLDEASQMVEPLTLNPLTTAKPRFIIMAGDPCQLGPVVASPAAVAANPPAATASARAPAHSPMPPTWAAARGPAERPLPQGLARPLLVRLVQMGHHAHLLRTQYRCHPAISRVPNALFYRGQLLDGCSAAQRPAVVPGLAAVSFMEVRGQQRYGQGSSSACNQAEAQAVVQVIQQLSRHGISSSSIGVICFFRAQVALIEGLLCSASRRPGCDASHSPEGQAEEQQQSAGASQDGQTVQIATVDSFQGMEKDIILLATTIIHAGNFATDAQRVNVALTRARHHLLVLGCSQVLRSSSPAFAMLLSSCYMLPPGGLLPPDLAMHADHAMPAERAGHSVPAGHAMLAERAGRARHAGHGVPAESAGHGVPADHHVPAERAGRSVPAGRADLGVNAVPGDHAMPAVPVGHAAPASHAMPVGHADRAVPAGYADQAVPAGHAVAAKRADYDVSVDHAMAPERAGLAVPAGCAEHAVPVEPGRLAGPDAQPNCHAKDPSLLVHKAESNEIQTHSSEGCLTGNPLSVSTNLSPSISHQAMQTSSPHTASQQDFLIDI